MSTSPRPSAAAGQLARTPAASGEAELAGALGELRARADELARLRAELDETNRGVIALYAELDQKADSLRQATELKSRFLANMSHEFRTPLNSIQSLARILLDGSEGPLNPDQAHAVRLMRSSALSLAEMVNDLLDLAKIEAGRVTVRPIEFDAQHLFGSLRGTLKPLQVDGVALVFEDVAGLPDLYGDESKISQVLRNFASNALKFTERGEVRLGARLEGDEVLFWVRDTGVGIAPEDQERIFEEFAQVDSAIQRKVKGTGLGLPLSRKLAALLGGTIGVESAPGAGSTFWLRLPLRFSAQPARAARDEDPVLAVLDDEQLVTACERFLQGTRYRLVAAQSLEDARSAVQREKFVAILAGPFFAGAPTRSLLAELKKTPATRDIPVLGLSAAEHEERLLALGANLIAPRPTERHQLLELLSRALSPARRVLLIAPEPSLRDELRLLLGEPRIEILEARDAADGLRRAREEQPRVALLDASQPGFAGAALALLRGERACAGLPVLVRAPRPLADDELAALKNGGAVIIATPALEREETGRRLRAAIWEAGTTHG